ncbi:hypothetical protein [Allomuricauda sp. SCSIO 65647]|uniref:hypothetical protein n=1 Tax=Allomuricauda sp. SCSIO 65647 TaxID=2908843 RepID=UPI001F417968|nr:hypothetical protein [Muricauda sp. SCSIO 65647]UJH66293.1 hypothetical protein L0P89_09950 [Muricauda sp. SCSIO 65647]
MKKTMTFPILLFVMLGTIRTSAQEKMYQESYLFDDVEAYLYSPDQERKKSRKFFVALKELAKKQNSTALFYLGMLQKEGLGTKQSFKKSLRSFKKSYELGNLEAAYCVGYYYLKGFGDVPQDYARAYRWFKKSESPMGRHWMAKMQFLGLGRKPNKAKALKMLRSNEIENSKVLLEQYETAQPPTGEAELFHALFEESPIRGMHELSNLHDVPDIQMLDGTWEGGYFELDWAKEKVLRTLPITLDLTKANGINESLGAKIKIADSISIDTGTYSSGALRFGNLTVPIRKQYTDYLDFTHLMTEIRGFELRICPYNGENLLIGRVNAHHPIWKERANPIIVVLKKKVSVSEAARTAFDEQAADFIRIYPNPVPDHCLINFELPHGAHVKVQMTNYYNTAPYHSVLFNGYREKGEHTIEVRKLPSRPGTYTLSIEYDGKIENKLIIKQ